MQNYTALSTFLPGEDILVHKEKADRNKNPHTHEFIELIFIYSGSGTHVIDGKRYSVKSGDILFVNFGKTHSFEMSEMEFVNILLRPEFMSEHLLNSENIFDVFALPQFSAIHGEYSSGASVSFSGNELLTVSGIIDTMLCEYNEKKPAYQTVLSAGLEMIFTFVIRKLKLKEEQNTKNAAALMAEYVDRHLFEKITLSDIAAHCFYNPVYFSRKFKMYFGKNLSDYVKERRLCEAARLLCDTDLTVTQIYTDCCFSDKSQFYRLFKKRFGCTPAEYRNSRGVL
ncbi:MAG: helix-turn-helix domain-containing protein [Clostridia bacterium]|nr:helix-turn-helix domain-containing protein [Clostridia bacterium]